ncbi:ABC transporter permease [Vibrio sp. SCSIO 43136]|uniref:ABC transporter permease n=1 Tax=Vibrio sp. SCSIO 43136 TaxID=2819101 RepID=UPI0020755B6C|nr:ABC transporter permease [Vibrio sp. SCSIO 43136]USD66474.1 ABC transporter permease [Vibrio sp. SCSIO 43136]
MSFFDLLKQELKSLLAHPAIVITIFGGTVFYSFLYPLPYAHQVAQEQQITVVNLDKSQTSFKLERMVDATPQVSVVSRTHSVEEAKSQFLAGKVAGILVIPEHFHRDLLMGKSPVLAYAGDASYFLVYGTVVEGLAKSAGTLSAQVKVTKLVMDGEPMALAKDQYSSTHLNFKPTFNPKMGYVDYVVPAVFILILHQTLIMGTGILTCNQKSRSGYWQNIHPARLTLARITAFALIYVLISMFYLGVSFDMYDINRLASIETIFILLIPFLIAAGALGVVIGNWVPRTELVTMLVLLSSMPLIFSAGFIWPIESIPEPIVIVSNLIPSTPAIMGFLKSNQMGAELPLIKHELAQLWMLAAGWLTIAILTIRPTKNAA